MVLSESHVGINVPHIKQQAVFKCLRLKSNQNSPRFDGYDKWGPSRNPKNVGGLVLEEKRVIIRRIIEGTL